HLPQALPSQLPRSAHPVHGVHHSSVYLATRPPARSTLFPYTTLFRSAAGSARRPPLREPPPRPHSFAPPPTSTCSHDITTASCLDRKSTRLNSSHDQISYAVFCLKKKKT